MSVHAVRIAFASRIGCTPRRTKVRCERGWMGNAGLCIDRAEAASHNIDVFRAMRQRRDRPGSTDRRCAYVVRAILRSIGIDRMQCPFWAECAR